MKEELEKALKNTVQGEQADRIKDEISKQMDRWGLVMPDVPPLVFDFGAGDVSAVGETEFWIANELEHGYCGKFMFLFSGQRCPKHLHNEKHETFFLVKGKLSMIYGNEEITMDPGDIVAVDTGVFHTFIALENSLVLEISRPSILSDNVFADGNTGYHIE